MKYALLACCVLVVLAVGLARPAMLHYRLWQARAALSDRDAEASLVWLEAAANLDPRSGEVAFLRARAYRRLAKPKRVRSELLRAAELGYPAEIIEREKILTMAQSGLLPPGSPEVTTLMRNPGDDTLEIYEAVVQGYLESYQVAAAFMLLDGWQSDYPEDPLSHYFYGLAWENQRSWAKAIEAFRAALQLRVGRKDTRLRLARALREDYRYRESLWHYERYLELDQSPDALFGQAQCLEALADHNGAHAAYERLLELAPKHFEGRLALGELEYSLGEYQKAVEQLELAVQQGPTEFNAQHALAWALLIAGEKERARKHFELAVKLQEVMHRVSMLQRRADKEPANADLRYEIGIALLQSERQGDAVVWLQSAVRLKPDHRAAHLALAEYYTTQANVEAAERHRQAAVSQ